jgi:hypothetical protein
MIFHHDNLFCQPSPSLLDATAGLFEWSLDNVTWQDGPPPANTLLYLRVTAARDFSDATYIQAETVGVGGVGFVAAGAYGAVTAQTTVGGIGAGPKLISVLAPSGNFDVGTFTFA